MASTELVTKKLPDLHPALVSWREGLGVAQKLALIVVMAGLTGLSAQIRIPLPFTPVPVTGQVFAVLFSGVLLGKWYGGASQLCYLLFGSVGIPIFSGFGAGLSVITGPTGGFLLGFVAAGWLVGWQSEKWWDSGGFWSLLFPSIGAVLIIYFFGALQLHLLLGTSLRATLEYGVLPFLGIDLIKVFLLATLGGAFTSRRTA